MISRLSHLLCKTSQVGKKCEIRNILAVESSKCLVRITQDQKDFFHTTLPRMKDWDLISRRRIIKETAKKANVADGEKVVDIDSSFESDCFPTVNLLTTIFDGMQFKDIPVVHVKATKNNTLLGLSDNNVVKLTGSCGREGFKNTKKGTNIAAQTAAVSFGMQALKRGFKTVRVVVKGFGPGRLSALKGLQIGGLNIVSVTDKTQDFTTYRPKKQRRL